MKNLEFLNFDTCQGDYSQSNNPYDCEFTLSIPMRNIRYIYLKSLELPVGFQNIRAGLNVLTFFLNYTAYTITIPPKVYTNIATLLTDINNLILALNLSITIVFSVNTANTNLIQITLGTASQLFIGITNLSRYILGIANQTISSSTILIANNNYLLNVDNYINIYLSNIPCQSNNNYNGIMSTFKIPLNCTSNTIFYQCENQSFTQYCEITDPSFVLSRLHIKISDRWGNVINANGLDILMITNSGRARFRNFAANFLNYFFVIFSFRNFAAKFRKLFFH